MIYWKFCATEPAVQSLPPSSTERAYYTAQVDRLLGDIFKKNVAVTGIEFLSFENPHTATPDDPYWSANGKAYASIKEAAARGEITPEEAIAAYRRLATP